jgi:ornithine decarboxylase
VRIARLNVGGGFPSHRLNGVRPELEAIFALIDRVATEAAFGAARPALVCEPGRGIVAEAFAGRRVKAVRDGEHVFLNDGVYGS